VKQEVDPNSQQNQEGQGQDGGFWTMSLGRAFCVRCQEIVGSNTSSTKDQPRLQKEEKLL
jgi:hypothetical protein